MEYIVYLTCDGIQIDLFVLDLTIKKKDIWLQITVAIYIVHGLQQIDGLLSY